MRSSKEREVKRRLADGTEREYRYSKTPQRAPRLAPDSLGALIAAYRLSPEWIGLAPATHKNRTYYTNSHSLVPMRPVPQSDCHDAPWLIGKFVPGLAAVVDNVVVGLEDAV